MESTRETAERLISELQHLATSVEQLEAERAQLLQLLEDSRRRFRIMEQVHERLRLLEREHQRFRALVEHHSDAIVLLNADCQVTYASPAIEQICGYPPAEFATLDPWSLLHGQERERVVLDLARLRDQPGTQAKWLLQLDHKTAAPRVVEVVCTNWLERPQIGAIVVCYRDVSERQRSDSKQLQRVEERARLEGVQLAGRELADWLNHELTRPIMQVEALSARADLPAEITSGLLDLLDGLGAIIEHVDQLHRVTRVATKATPAGVALDLARSLRADGER